MLVSTGQSTFDPYDLTSRDVRVFNVPFQHTGAVMSKSLQESYVHKGGDVPLLGCTIDEAFRSTVEKFPDREAFVSKHQSQRLTFKELDQRVEQLARGLMALNVQPGERVGIWSTNNTEWLLMQLATARVGAIQVNINPSYREGELEYALKLVDVNVLVTIPAFRSSDYLGMIRSICPELNVQDAESFHSEKLPALRNVVVYDPLDATYNPPAPGLMKWNTLLAKGESITKEDIEARSSILNMDDPINIQFTSGTTGHPKAVLLTHHGITNNAYFVGDIMGMTEEDRLCVPVPFYHCFGMVISNLACLLYGSTIVTPSEYFNAEAALLAVEEERCTAMHGVPTMFIAVLHKLAEQNRTIDHLRTGIMAGAPCPPEIMRRVMNELGCKDILIAYGQTEASPVTHLTRPNDTFERRVETVGTNLPHQEVKIVDPETNRVVPVGVQGEVCFRGYHVMRGYYANPEATRDAIGSAGWLHSGDLGVLDKDGYLKITGRIKDMIIRGGENIFPAEIEARLYQHPSVEEAAVFGVPDDFMGEEVGTWIKLEDGATLEEEEVRDYIREHMARFNAPRYIWFVDSFPMTVTGKIQKFKIRDTVAEWIKNDSKD